MSDGNMTYEDWLRGCVHHDGRHGYVTLPCDEVLKIADFIEKLRADRKTENSSEKPNNCDTCRFELYCPEMCEGCCEWDSHYEPKDESQTCSFSDCDNFKNPDYERCIECKRKQIKLKTEQTERSNE